MPDIIDVVSYPPTINLLSNGPPGPPGPQGPQGLPGVVVTPADIGALAVSLRLSEFESEEAKAAARANIGLHVIDGGTF